MNLEENETPSEVLDLAADSIAAEVLPNSEEVDPQETGADQPGLSPPSADPESKTARPPASESFSPNAVEIPEPPSSLTKEEQEQWKTLSPEARNIISRREENFHKGISEIKPVAELGMGLGKILSPFFDTYRAYGVNPISHIENLATYHHALMFGRPDQKAEILLGLARDSGIDLRQLVGQVAPEHFQTNDSALQRELASVKAQLSNVNGRFQKQDNEALYAHVEKIANDAENFPYFFDVVDGITEILTTSPELGLERAYKLAIAQNDAVQERLMQKRISAANAKAREEASQAARARGTRLQQSSHIQPQSGSRKKIESIDDAIDDVFADFQASSSH